MLVGPSKCLKQIIQIELNRVKNPNWPEANQLTIYKHGRGFQLETTVNNLNLNSDLNLGLELGASELQVQRSNRSATLPKNRLVTYFTEVTAPVRKSSPQGNGISK